MATRLVVRGLTIELPTPTGWIKPVNDVSFTLEVGETLGIVGESGSGKTILSLALMGLQPHGARRFGTAQLANLAANGDSTRTQQSASESLTAQVAADEDLIAATPSQMRGLRGRGISMIFQEPMTALNPVMRVGAQIAEAIRVHESGLSRAEIDRRVLNAMERAAIREPQQRSRQYPHQLSGGLRQRVMIAIALAASPGVLIADEPTTALDVTVQKQILDLLEKLRSELRLSILFITHDLGVVAQVASRIAVMYAGRIVEEGPIAEVLSSPRHPYTQGLLRAAPRLTHGKLLPIPGLVPNLHSLPPGCAFAPRCPLFISQCDQIMPPLIRPSEASETHHARCILAE